MEKNILEIKDLSISFVQYYKGLNRKVINVVRNLSLDVKEKEVLAIFGASGSGKSLLVHAILDLLPINAIVKGDIKYKGENLTSKRLEKLRRNEISFIPQTINSRGSSPACPKDQASPSGNPTCAPRCPGSSMPEAPQGAPSQKGFRLPSEWPHRPRKF